MAEIVNPYIAGAPVTEQRMFFGREDIFDWIEKSLSGQYADHILVVHGQRRVGKTSVLKQLGNRLPPKYIPVFFDLQGRTHTTLDRFLWWLARETVRVLKQERSIEVPPPEKDDFAKDAEYFENAFLPNLRPFMGDASLLYTFDEFDNLEESDVKEELARPLTDYLRRLMGRGEMNFIYSIGSSGRKLENMQAAYTEFFKTALYKKISFLSEEQTHGLVTRPVARIIEYERAAVERIYGIASGHPYFTQLTCHELFARCQRTEQRRITQADVEAILDDVVERGTVNLKFVWDEASDVERWILAALAHLDKTDNRALADFLRKQRVRFSDSDLTSSLLHLREKDVLTSENRFVIHLLKLWLQKNRTIEQVREELTEVNPIANRYIEIGLEFKDAGLFDKAIESFREALAVAPANTQAQVNIALAYMDQKIYDRAITEFEKALSIDDEDVASRAGLCDAHLALGDAAIQRNRVKEAVQSYQRVLDINAEHTEARQRMAELSRQRAEKALSDGKSEEALNAFAEALKFTPEDPALIERVEKIRAEKRAEVLAAQVARSEKEAAARNWDKAIAALKEALETAPGDESILNKIEEIKARQEQARLHAIIAKAEQAENAGRWDAAIVALNEYLLLKPEAVEIQKRLKDLMSARRTAWLEAVLARSKQALSAERWDEAVASLNEVLAVEPENADFLAKVAEVRRTERTARINALVRRAEQALQTQKWDEAVNALNDGIVMEPGDQRLQAMLVQALESKRAARLNAALRLAETAAQAGKWGTALDALNSILALEPDNEEIQKKLADVEQKQRASQLNALRSQARGLARAEKFDESLAAWQAYLEMQPDDQDKALAEIEKVKKGQFLAKTYAEAQQAFARKNYDKAAGLYKTVVVEDADYKDASHWLAESIELRRTARKWWKNRWLWGGIGIVALAAIAWSIIRYGLPILTSAPTSLAETGAATATREIAPAPPTATSTPTPTPTPLPLAWTRLSSGQFLPRDQVTAIVIDPTDQGVMYAGTANAGIYKSIDGGASWQPVHTGLGRASIDTLIADPRDTKTLYAGTLLGGVYKTTDAGSNWQAVNTGIDIRRGNEWVAMLVMDAQNNEHLYFTDADTIYETENGGISWKRVSGEGKCPQNFVGLVADPADGNILYTADTGGELSNCPGGVYKSSTGGKSWSLTNLEWESWETLFKGLWIEPVEGKNLYVSPSNLWVSNSGGNVWSLSSENSCGSMAFDTQDRLTAYCASYDVLLKTSNGGLQWTRLANNTTGWASAMAVSPQDHNTLFVGASGLLKSVDGGKTWQERNSGLGGSSIELKLLPNNPSVLYAQASGNIYRSEDRGRNWGAFGAGDKLSFDQDGNLHYLLSGILEVSIDNGKSWKRRTLPQPDAIHALAVHPHNPNRVYILYGRNRPPYIYYSDDTGETWQAATGMRDVHNARLVFDGDSGQRVYAIGDLEASRSDDGGLTWTNCGDFLPGIWASISDARAVVDPSNNNHLYLATRGDGVIVSNDGCATWRTTNKGGLGSLFVNTLAIDPNDTETIYAATDGGAFVSFDSGTTWNQINNGLLGATVVYSIVVDNESNVYAATPYGIFKLESK